MSTATAPQTEQDQRLTMLNSLMTTPHRDIDAVHTVHRSIITTDPLFYSHLAAWYFNGHGEVRDHQEVFVTNLCLSNFEGHRDVGLALLRNMPPYQVCRIADYISGKKIKKVTKVGDTSTVALVDYGLFKPLPNSFKTEVTRYLRDREADEDWFDSCVLTARKYMKRLYALCHVPRSDRVGKILFENDPPEGSKIAVIKQLLATDNPVEQAKIIVANKLPYRVASTVIKVMSPTIIYALIEVMTPQELINNLKSLKARGAFNDPGLKELIDKKLVKAKDSKRVSALKTTVAADAADVDEGTKVLLGNIADKQLKSNNRQITWPTALLIDKSGSMEVSIELGKRIAAMVSSVSTANLFVYAYDTMPYPIKCNEPELSAWEKALKGVRAGGGTSCGCGVMAMINAKQYVDQIINITDEDETTPPGFWQAVSDYRRKVNNNVSVVIVQAGRATGRLVRSAPPDITVDAWKFNGDYYSLPQLLTFMTRPSKLDLLMEVMNTELPQRLAS